MRVPFDASARCPCAVKVDDPDGRLSVLFRMVCTRCGQTAAKHVYKHPHNTQGHKKHCLGLQHPDFDFYDFAERPINKNGRALRR